jgi:nitrite reductase/ring-hydroxylating ferredoxin subunit
MSQDWVRVAALVEVPEGNMLAVEVAGEPIALYNLGDDEICATHNICTHETACLTEGWLDGCIVECPLHAGQFNVRTGEGMGPPIERNIAVYPVRVEAGEILIDARRVEAAK